MLFFHQPLQVHHTTTIRTIRMLWQQCELLENQIYLLLSPAILTGRKFKKLYALRPGEEAWERNDLLARIFKIKLKELRNDITEKNIFGVPVGHIHVIEFQKQGLPHAHILAILQSSHKPRTEEDYDAFVCAEIPDPKQCPRLYALVTKHMLHGPVVQLILPVYAWTRIPAVAQNISLRTRQMKHQLKKMHIQCTGVAAGTATPKKIGLAVFCLILMTHGLFLTIHICCISMMPTLILKSVIWWPLSSICTNMYTKGMIELLCQWFLWKILL